ncbi:MAG: nuclear transport factor 2 family protein [Reyranella sp.]|nr:nuclear transport factor 2 family protein [Reyranella sp.]
MIVDEVRQIIEAKADALIRRTADDLAALLHPDFVYVNAGGTAFDKAGYIDTYCISGKVVFAEQQISDLNVNLLPVLPWRPSL